jgi:hypothetical protein
VSMPGELLKPGERFGPVRIFSAAEIMAEELPPVPWVVPDILPEGVTFLAGKPKMGKSWMVLGLGIAVATGGVALGTKRVEQGEVLYLALEDKSPRRIQNRLDKLLGGRPAPENLRITYDWPRLDDGGADLLDDWVAVHPDARLVIADTLAMLKPQTNGRRTQYDEDREAVAPFAPIAADHNVAILLVHLREAESDDPLDMITGSVGLTGGVDGALVLKRKRGQADAYLHVDGRDIENPTELALNFDQNAATWAVMGDAEEYRKSETRRKIMEAAVEWPAGPKEVADILDMPENTVKQRMYQMSQDGELKVVSRGLYELP